jgi:UDP-glucuronate 4-epimerase
MNVLVTGGAGFIGSHVCERLLRLGQGIVIVDDLNDYYPSALKLANLRAISRIGPVRFHRSDICDEQAIDAIFAAIPIGTVIHLAARAGVRPSLEAPLLYERVNVYGTNVLLEACRKHGVRRFIFASSSSVYGAANAVPFRESDTDVLPVSPYAATKIAGEKLCFTYSHLFGISCVCLRFFTVFGPRQRPDLAIRKFAEMIARGDRIPVYGDGSSGRDYTFVSDIVDGITAALSLDSRYDIFNLGNSSPVSLIEMIRTLEELVGAKALIDWLPPQPGDVPITFADISKAKAMLGYSPTTTLRDGIRRFLEWQVECTMEAIAGTANGCGR